MSIMLDEANAYESSRDYNCCQIIDDAFTVGCAVNEAYCAGRDAPPADAEIEAVTKRLLWDSCKRYDDEYAAKDEEEAWSREGCFPEWQEDHIRQAKELLALARKTVNE